MALGPAATATLKAAVMELALAGKATPMDLAVSLLPAVNKEWLAMAAIPTLRPAAEREAAAAASPAPLAAPIPMSRQPGISTAWATALAPVAEMALAASQPTGKAP
jgi:hypothetical protein